MKEQLSIKNFPDIKVDVYADTVWAYLNVSESTFRKNGVQWLSDNINELKRLGFKEFSTSYNTGYYDSVEDITLEFRTENNAVLKAAIKQ